MTGSLRVRVTHFKGEEKKRPVKVIKNLPESFPSRETEREYYRMKSDLGLVCGKEPIYMVIQVIILPIYKLLCLYYFLQQ